MTENNSNNHRKAGQSDVASDSANIELLGVTQSLRQPRRSYEAPMLTLYGDVRDITMGPTVGFGESGGGPFCAEGVNCP